MSITKKLVLTVALTLAATASASASAYATATITPSTTYIATQNAPGTLVSDLGATITCDTSRFTAVVGTGAGGATATAQTMTFTGLNSSACTASVGGCTVTIETLPAKVTVNKATTTATTVVATWTKDAAIENITILCGANLVHCDASVDTTLTGTVDASDEAGGTFDIVNEPVDIGPGSFGCGTTATWTASWTITTPDSYLITP